MLNKTIVDVGTDMAKEQVESCSLWPLSKSKGLDVE